MAIPKTTKPKPKQAKPKQAKPKQTKVGPKKKSRKPNKKTPSRRWRWKVIVVLVLSGAIVLITYCLFLDVKIRQTLDNKRWSVPSRVYARAQELYVGREISPQQLVAELVQLGYRHRARPAKPGLYRQRDNIIDIHVRSFKFGDEVTVARPIALQFDNNVIVSLAAKDGQSLDIVRLDPIYIGSIYPTHKQDRILVPLADVPSKLITTLLAVEDHGFFDHHGIEPLSIVRALWVNIQAGKTVQGGSTLTQQLVKNLFLSNQRSWWRKFQEAVMSLLVERRYGKQQILEIYFNEIYLGQDGDRAIHGFALASHFYFGKPLAELLVEEIALLVGMIKGPSAYHPRKHPQRTQQRRNVVLQLMAQHYIIDKTAAKAASRQPLRVLQRQLKGSTRYPGFIDLVKRQITQDYQLEDLSRDGLHIFTTLDTLAQRAAEQVMIKQVMALEKSVGIAKQSLQAAMLIADSATGDVLAVVGGREPSYAGFNRALDALRPVGSLVKPAVYLSALLHPKRYHLVSVLDDKPLAIPDGRGGLWQPENYKKTYQEQIYLYQALANSNNVATVNLGLQVGLENIIETLQKLGMSRPIPPYPSLLLGAFEMTPFEVLQMYQTLAAEGFKVPLKSILTVTTAQGEPLQRYPLSVEQVLPADAVYLVNTALQHVVRYGTAKSLRHWLSPELTLAGKTGTTNNYKDSWFAGFSGDRVAVAWMGIDANISTRLTGATGAMRLWGDVMSRLLMQQLMLNKPVNVDYRRIDIATGLLGGEACLQTVMLPFIESFAPTQTAPCAQKNGASGVQDKRLFR